MRNFVIILILCVKHNLLSSQTILGTEVANIEKVSPKLDEIIRMNSTIEILADGLKWVEGPLWVEREKMLLFSDVPTNTVYKWTEKGGAEIYLQPSGFTTLGESKSREPGSNGLLLDAQGNLVLCQHGDRRMARMNSSLDKPRAEYITLVSDYKGSRFNSPNDAVFAKDGRLFFTDPPYGLPTQDDNDPTKEIDFNGVYCLKPNGELVLLTQLITRPNGVGVFPSGDKILVANSDSKAATWYIIDLLTPANSPTIFYDATNQRAGVSGLPDGLKISKAGYVFASGPGGVWIFDEQANLLGKIKLKSPVSNVALSQDEKYLYLTNTNRVLRIPLK